MLSLEFDLEFDHDDFGVIRAIGTVDPGESPTGPTYPCGGTPGEPAHVDDYKIFQVGGDTPGEEIVDPDGKILDSIEDDILEAVANSCYEAQNNEREDLTV